MTQRCNRARDQARTIVPCYHGTVAQCVQFRLSTSRPVQADCFQLRPIASNKGQMVSSSGRMASISDRMASTSSQKHPAQTSFQCYVRAMKRPPHCLIDSTFMFGRGWPTPHRHMIQILTEGRKLTHIFFSQLPMLDHFVFACQRILIGRSRPFHLCVRPRCKMC